MDLREVGYDGRDWINLAQDRDRWRVYVRAAMNLRVLKILKVELSREDARAATGRRNVKTRVGGLAGHPRACVLAYLSSADELGISMLIRTGSASTLLFADDMVLLAEEEMILRDMLLELNDSCEQYGMKINANKTKTMVIERKVKKVPPPSPPPAPPPPPPPPRSYTKFVSNLDSPGVYGREKNLISCWVGQSV
ncbi:hypothetical protein ANN_11514 [Periplaneta americana]|uniref:Reverse transcriptase domain-containing protein n=1 Tax=Periplaneta americana TaxID=6978 RepID=A0ABQ8T581_PERAM|nr:hypothetical protein ANN_11514 [Periplaneta americana]